MTRSETKCVLCKGQELTEDAILCGRCMLQQVFEAMEDENVVGVGINEVDGSIEIEVKVNEDEEDNEPIEVWTEADEADFMHEIMGKLHNFMHDYASRKDNGKHLIEVAMDVIERQGKEILEYEKLLDERNAHDSGDAERYRRALGFYAKDETYQEYDYGRNIDLDKGLFARTELQK